MIFNTNVVLKGIVSDLSTKIVKFMGPTWGPPGSCELQMGPMLAPWTLLSGLLKCILTTYDWCSMFSSKLCQCRCRSVMAGHVSWWELRWYWCYYDEWGSKNPWPSINQANISQAQISLREGVSIYKQLVYGKWLYFIHYDVSSSYVVLHVIWQCTRFWLCIIPFYFTVHGICQYCTLRSLSQWQLA